MTIAILPRPKPMPDVFGKLRELVRKGRALLAGSYSDYLEDEIQDHVHDVGSFTAPTAVYAALFTVAPTDAGGGTEVSGGSYARVAVTFGASSGGAIANSAAITFTTATGNWGTVVAVALFDASTSGNMLEWADLSVSKAVGDGDTAEFPIGDYNSSLS